jgi:hypothetical protein
MCAELDVVNVKVDDRDSYVILRMTWAQQKAYQDGRFTPRYLPGTTGVSMRTATRSKSSTSPIQGF